MLNKSFIMGRLTRDPELRRTQSGTAVTSFSLAVDRDFKGQNGERETDFIDCVAWRNTAEFVTKYFAKGRMAVVEGRIQMREYEDKDGKKQRVFEINADSVYFGDSKREGDAQGGGGSYGQHNKPQGQPPQGQPSQSQYSQGQYSQGQQRQPQQINMNEIPYNDPDLPF
ncbi:single-stranded DNA-binding protein [Bengtsoniella intestinalis]|uniref:single-stranded DNA-binding protein n=1 Tax=Bengtsoniella intestinalis TaxID=3073143 RepID=UPI00391FB094